jgi:Domain of unknown function (DUF3885)
MSLKDQVIERFGNKAFSMRPTFYHNEGALRFELGVGDDSLSNKITALHRFNTLLDDLGFKRHPIGIAAYCYTYDTSKYEKATPLHQQLLPFARELSIWADTKFSKSDFLRIPNDDNGFITYHFSETSIDHGLLSDWIIRHLLRDFGGSNTPLLMLFNIDLGIIINPYDNRGMDVFGPNHDLLKRLYHKRNHWLLEYDRERMDELYKD